ncbi:protein of unknown function (plasmid) [Thermococcus nautili]|nr:protein of unknown function [Thermococcus nautili]
MMETAEFKFRRLPWEENWKSVQIPAHILKGLDGLSEEEKYFIVLWRLWNEIGDLEYSAYELKEEIRAGYYDIGEAEAKNLASRRESEAEALKRVFKELAKEWKGIRWIEEVENVVRAFKEYSQS